MPTEITVPRLGWSMEEAAFTEWLKRDGDWVAAGDMLFVIEGDKAAQEIESFDAGLLRLGPSAPRPGETVKVGQVIGYLLAQGESAPWEQAESSRAAPDEASENEPAPPRSGQDRSSAAGPDARRLARQLGVDLAQVSGSGRGGRIVAADVRAAATGERAGRGSAAAHADGHTAVATPRARRLARELNLDWRVLAGSGRGGRVRERDIRAAETSASHRPPADRTAHPPGPHGTLSTATLSTAAPAPATPISPTRRTIAERMVASLRATAPVTLTSRASATNLLGLRSQFKAAAHSPAVAVPTVTDIVVKLTAAALAQHPALNSRWEGESIVAPSTIDIGIAVDVEFGLVVPVVRDVARLGLRELAERARELAERARARRLSGEELAGGTFTVSNLGGLGIDAFTPIINPPQTAILGIGAIRRQPIVLADDRIVPGDVLTLSLTFDHRLLDGAPAARFLQSLVAMIESPAAWLVA
jgi:pyruvate dehydrogenase E2 component (dihydrolipoamide acetyltransferase)